MSHSQRCLDANRFGDGFDCICDEEPLPRALAQIEKLQRELAEALQRNQQLIDANARVAADVLQWRQAQDALSQRNLFLSKQLEDVDDIASNEERDGDDAVELIREVLSRPRPEHVGPPGLVLVNFSWRSPQHENGLHEVFPGDGYGFAEYVEGFGLRMQFECAGVQAFADMSLDALKHTLAKEGFSIWPMVCEEGDRFTDPVIRDMRTRIEELERRLKSEEGENERLMRLHYGEDDERDHVRIAVDRAKTLGAPADHERFYGLFSEMSTIAVQMATSANAGTLTYTLKRSGYAVTLQACEIRDEEPESDAEPGKGNE